ncbi:hypothetical protein NDU88_005235 [Pleurodeles waltl]|uniref:Myb/SANT-like DNA-binding domain-containing protein n=1 Tax=Pleurodeles waltl TaxID=8319 RepID=A0AAV7TAP1_PLEWA|nr:hypothetical protein NDU88_005235 [Pleurodeles waltl]
MLWLRATVAALVAGALQIPVTTGTTGPGDVVAEVLVWDLGDGRGEDLHCKCCCDLGLEETMVRVSGERASAFTSEELEKLVDGVLPQYTLLYGPPDKQVSAHQNKYIWRAIAKDVRTLGVYHRRSTHCCKTWEDIRHWSKKTAEAQLGMASQRWRGARRTMTPLMFRILVVAYPELDGRLRASKQPQGASSGGGAVAPENEGAASHMALEGETTDSEFTSGTEGEGSSTAGTGADTSNTDSSSDGSSLVVAATSMPPHLQIHKRRRPPPAPAHLTRRPPPGPAHLPRRPPPALAPLGHEGQPAKAPLGHEGPPAKALLGHEGPPAAETLQWRPTTQAPLNRAPPSQAPLNRAPTSQAPLAYERQGH